MAITDAETDPRSNLKWIGAFTVSFVVHYLMVWMPISDQTPAASGGDNPIRVTLINWVPQEQIGKSQTNLNVAEEQQTAALEHYQDEPVAKHSELSAEPKIHSQSLDSTPKVPSKWLQAYLGGRVTLPDEVSRVSTPAPVEVRVNSSQTDTRRASVDGTVRVGLDQQHQYAGHCFLERTMWDGSKSVPILYPTQCSRVSDDSERFLRAVEERLKLK